LIRPRLSVIIQKVFTGLSKIFFYQIKFINHLARNLSLIVHVVMKLLKHQDVLQKVFGAHIVVLLHKIYAKMLNVIIVLNGHLHHQYWQSSDINLRMITKRESPETIQLRDKFKEERAKENGYNVKRILPEDIWYNRNNWEEQMIRILEKNEACS
jgi:hypothetical protein